MNLGKQKKLAARALGVSTKRVKIKADTADSKKQVKELISREGVRDLLGEKVLVKSSKKGNSRTRANHIASQKKKGRRQGQGSRSGTANARHSRKDKWMTKIRAMRKLLMRFRDQGAISTSTYRNLYLKCKGNFFRNKGHVVLYMEQNEMFDSNVQKEKVLAKDKKEEPKKETKAVAKDKKKAESKGAKK